MVKDLHDEILLSLAEERMAGADLSKTISAEEVYQQLEITKEELADTADIEIE